MHCYQHTIQGAYNWKLKIYKANHKVVDRVCSTRADADVTQTRIAPSTSHRMIVKSLHDTYNTENVVHHNAEQFACPSKQQYISRSKKKRTHGVNFTPGRCRAVGSQIGFFSSLLTRPVPSFETHERLKIRRYIYKSLCNKTLTHRTGIGFSDPEASGFLFVVRRH